MRKFFLPFLMGLLLASGVITASAVAPEKPPGGCDPWPQCKRTTGSTTTPSTVSSTVITTQTTIPVNTWTPAPPSSYSATGTVVIDDVGAVSGSTQLYSFWGPHVQHVAKNAYGLFIAYSHRTENHVPEYWTLKKSTTGGASWVQKYNSETAGQPATGQAPMLETDNDGNIYVIAGSYGNVAYPAPIRIWKFGPGDDFTTPTVYTLPTATAHSAGKMTTHYDPGRNWIWFLIWADGRTPAELWAVDTSGNIVFSKNFFRPLDEASGIYPHYPLLYVARNGHLYVGWFTVDFPLNDGLPPFSGNAHQNYYSIHFVYSTDGGATFLGPLGTVSTPVTGDDSTNTTFAVVDYTNSSEFIHRTAPGYGSDSAHFNWNAVVGFAYNSQGGSERMHIVYMGGNPQNHIPYARWTKSGNTFSRISPYFVTGTTTAHVSDNGCFVQDTSMSNRIYWVGMGTGPDFNKVVAYKSDNGGTTWTDYAKSAPIAAGYILYLSCFRYVDSDGMIYGGFVNEAISPYRIKSFRITPN